MAQLVAHPSSTSSSHVQAKRERRRAEILRAALQAFGAKGYHDATLEQIAAHLGMRATALYHYFPDKEAILYECHRQSLDEVGRVPAEARARYAGAAERVRHVIREHVRVMTDTLQGSALALEVAALNPAHRAEIVAARDRYEHSIRAIIEAGIAAGELRPQDAKVVVFALLGAINWIARWYRPDGSVPAADLGAQFADMLVGGLT
jgi:AcrR family transcriptional regulator